MGWGLVDGSCQPPLWFVAREREEEDEEEEEEERKGLGLCSGLLCCTVFAVACAGLPIVCYVYC